VLDVSQHVVWEQWSRVHWVVVASTACSPVPLIAVFACCVLCATLPRLHLASNALASMRAPAHPADVCGLFWALDGYVVQLLLSSRGGARVWPSSAQHIPLSTVALCLGSIALAVPCRNTSLSAWLLLSSFGSLWHDLIRAEVDTPGPQERVVRRDLAHSKDGGSR